MITERICPLSFLSDPIFDTFMGDCYSHGLSKSAIFFFENNCGKSVDEHQLWGFESAVAQLFFQFFFQISNIDVMTAKLYP